MTVGNTVLTGNVTSGLLPFGIVRSRESPRRHLIQYQVGVGSLTQQPINDIDFDGTNRRGTLREQLSGSDL